MNTSGDVAAKLTQIETRFCHTELHIESSGIWWVPNVTAIRGSDK